MASKWYVAEWINYPPTYGLPGGDTKTTVRSQNIIAGSKQQAKLLAMDSAAQHGPFGNLSVECCGTEDDYEQSLIQLSIPWHWLDTL
jgi:hypothetical protein